MWTHAKDNSKAAPVRLEVNDSPVVRDGKFNTSFAPVVKKVAPSVVKVFVTAKAKPAALSSHGRPDLRRFFGEGENGPDSPHEFRGPNQHGVGSGVIVTKDGYILTNNHVVEGADDIKVALNDGREFSAKVIGRDPQTDIAVLKIDAHDLPFLTVADSDKIEVGDVVLAIGNPFGIGQTVTTGIISAKGRATLGLDYEDFIQTDAAINPGNSGGALVDTDGRLIGINTAILSHSGGNQGIGFAVPTNLARWVMEGLVQNGRVERGFLGVNIQDLTPASRKGVQARPGQWSAGVGSHAGKSRRKGWIEDRRCDRGIQWQVGGRQPPLEVASGRDHTRFFRAAQIHPRRREQDS